MTQKFTIIGTDDCKWCDAIKVFLEDRGYTYNFLKLGDGTDNLTQFFVSLGFKTVPQVWHGTSLVGGHDATVSYVKTMDYLTDD